MKNNYKHLLFSLLVLAFWAVGSAVAIAQTPEISIWGYNENGRRISPGSAKNPLYTFQLNVTEANDVLQSLTIPIRGTVTTADVAPNGFRLWYRTYFGDYEEVLAGTASLSGNGDVVFANINVPLNRDPSGNGGHEFQITADLATGATPGRTIGVAGFPLSNFTFERAISVIGSDPMNEGNQSTVALPAITISSSGPAAGVLSPGSVNSVLYKLNVMATNASASFTSISFTTSGTYQLADITRFRLFAGDEEGFENDDVIATTASVASGGQLTFALTDATLHEEEDVVLYVVADVASGAAAGRTVQVQAVAPSQVTAVSGTISGSTTAGGVQTITIPSVAFTAAGPAAGIVSPGAIAVLHSVRIDVSDAPATLQNATFQVSGTFEPSDLGFAFDSDGDGINDGIEGLYLVYHKTTNLLDEIENGNEGDIYLLGYTETLPTSGGTLVFNSLAIEDEDVNPTIPLGTGYITVASYIRETAVLGRTIQVSASGTGAYGLASGNKSGTTGAGGLQTITAPAIAISAVATPAGNIGVGTREAVIYKIKVDASDAPAILKSLQLTTGGTYEESDINEFVLFQTTDDVLDTNNTYPVGYASSVESGGILAFEELYGSQIQPGKSSYLYVVLRAGGGESEGRTINIAPTPAAAFTFVAGTISGTFPLPAGGLQTFIAPTVAVTVPGVAQQNLAGGTNNNVIHRFNVAVSGTDAYPEYLMLKTTGDFESDDLAGSGLKLWYNTTDAFAGSKVVSRIGLHGSGGEIGTGIYNAIIRQSTTGYFFITADVAPAAPNGRTMQVEVVDLQFASGQVAVPENSASPMHTIGVAAAVPTLAVSYPALTPATITKGTADNVIYRFNVVATDANALLNYISFYTGGSFSSSDLAANGLKLWHNTVNDFDGSTLVHTFATNGGDGYAVEAGLANVQINAGATGYFFITATVSATASNNRTVRISELNSLEFTSGETQLSGSRGATFTIISTPLSLIPDAAPDATVVYPNPYREQETLTIETNSASPKLVTIFSASGKVVTKVEMTETKQLTLSNLSKGLYLIQVQHLKDNKVEVKKLLVQ